MTEDNVVTLTAADGNEPAPAANDNPAAAAPRVINFVTDVIKPGDKEGPGAEFVAVLNKLVSAGMAQGFSEEQATRALGVWLTNLAWTTLMQHTGLMGQAFFTVVFPQAPEAK